jgi:hypothetical protein
MTEHAPWFSAVGVAFTPAVREAVDAIRDRHPLLDGVEVVTVATWRDALRIVGATDWDSRWADFEEAERERLWLGAADRVGEDELYALVTAATAAVADAVRRAAAAAAAQGAAIDDPRLLDAASGSALMAVQHGLLAREAGEAATHCFTAQLELYRQGRWPLGYHRGHYHVF